MPKALRELLDGVIDYAGLFPPARLEMDDALSNFIRYSRGNEAWIMTRFVCAAAKLDDLQAEIEIQDPPDPLPVAAVGTLVSDARGWEDALAADAEAMTAFGQDTEGTADIEAYEIRVPDHGQLRRYVADLRGFNEAEVFVELPWAEDMTTSLDVIAEAEFSAKFRTGGISADAFPSSLQLAGFIHDCLSIEVPFKLTAGLHHAMPTIDSATGARMHGFLNALAAAALIYSEDLPRAKAAAVLEENDAAAFKFTDDALIWREHRAGLDAISEMRGWFVGFGSCSIDEPLADLTYLRLLDRN